MVGARPYNFAGLKVFVVFALLGGNHKKEAEKASNRDQEAQNTSLDAFFRHTTAPAVDLEMTSRWEGWLAKHPHSELYDLIWEPTPGVPGIKNMACVPTKRNPRQCAEADPSFIFLMGNMAVFSQCRKQGPLWDAF